MTRRAAWLVVAALAGAVAWRLLAAASYGGNAWSTVARGDLVVTVDVAGTLEAIDAARLGPPTLSDHYSFTIAMMAPEGETVEVGDPVLGFDTSSLEQELERTAAELDSARARVERQRIDLEIEAGRSRLRVAEAEAELRKARLAAGRPPELVSSIEFDKARLDLELAGTQLEAVHREVDAARRAGEALLAGLEADQHRHEVRVAEISAALEVMTVVAPRAGIVIHTAGYRNETWKVGDTCWYGDVIVEIPDLARMKGRGQVDEAEGGQVATGQPVALRLDAHPDIELSGRVLDISRTVTRASRGNPEKIFRIEIALDASDPERMRPGMRFRGSIEVDRRPDVLVVPLDAVHLTPSGPVVYRKSGASERSVPVELGARNLKEIEVISGLGQGDRVRVVPTADIGRNW